ncbi:MAG: ParB N-terminal domain-containing protein [Candidatus Beckwithbacteria bacterium]|nr:ParB N-terminal domain-containing protein [Candidatus Beckwithbacteria bacterium]
MRQGVRLVAIDKLRAHEEVSPQRLALVMSLINQKGIIVNPVIIDKKTRIILDGHHRVESLKRLGYRLVPAMSVDYFSDQVRVYSRRRNMRIFKEKVVAAALKKQVFPQKTTRHLIKNRIRGVKIKLNQLK